MTHAGKITLLISEIFKQVPRNYLSRNAFHSDGGEFLFAFSWAVQGSGVQRNLRVYGRILFCKDVEWINLAHDKDKVPNLTNTLMNSWGTHKPHGISSFLE
jgi:hypothetical protein